MPIHPFDDEVRLYEDKTVAKDKYTNSRLEAGMHTGTHIDAPRHFIDGSTYIGDFTPERFIGNGCLLDVLGEVVISYKPELDERIQENSIVLLYTGFGELYSKGYYENADSHPTIDAAFAELLAAKKVKMLGIDTPSPDHYPYNIHNMLFANGIFILENLTNLDKLLGIPCFEVIALPLKINAEASLVRAIARY